MLKPIAGLGPDVVGFEAEGVVTAKDYAERLIPAVERVLEQGWRPRLLYVLGPPFERFELKAMLADARVGISHLADFERIAVVTGHGAIEHTVRAFAALIPCPVRIFADGEIDAARSWIDERSADSVDLVVERSDKVARVHVRLRGALDREAEERLIRTATEGIGNAEELRLLVEAVDFHGWRDLSALWQHLRFVAGQRKKVERIAIVGDAAWQRRLIGSAKHVLRIDARFFGPDRLAEAKAWLAK